MRTFTIALCSTSLAVGALGQLREVWTAYPADPLGLNFVHFVDGVFVQDGSIVLCGDRSGGALVTARVSPEGVPIWAQRRYEGTPGVSTMGFASMHVVGDGTFLACGRFSANSDYRLILHRYRIENGGLESRYEDHASGASHNDIQKDEGLFLLHGINVSRRPITTRFDEQSMSPIWQRQFDRAQVHVPNPGLCANGLIMRNLVGIRSGIMSPLFLAYDQDGNSLGHYWSNATGGMVSSGHSSMITHLSSDRFAASYHMDTGGWTNEVYGIEALNGIIWSQQIYSGSPIFGSFFALWTDHMGRMFGFRRTIAPAQTVLQFDPNFGTITRTIELPHPPGYSEVGYSGFGKGPRGEQYMIGLAYNLVDGIRRDVHRIVHKRDRNLRAVWTAIWPAPSMSWHALKDDCLYLMNGTLSRPPLTKYKILAVRSEGDLNEDGCIDDTDLAIVLKTFGTSDPWGDANDGGIVDDLDLEEVLHNFGLGCE